MRRQRVAILGVERSRSLARDAVSVKRVVRLAMEPGCMLRYNAVTAYDDAAYAYGAAYGNY